DRHRAPGAGRSRDRRLARAPPAEDRSFRGLAPHHRVGADVHARARHPVRLLHIPGVVAAVAGGVAVRAGPVRGRAGVRRWTANRGAHPGVDARLGLAARVKGLGKVSGASPPVKAPWSWQAWALPLMPPYLLFRPDTGGEGEAAGGRDPGGRAEGGGADG